MKKIRSFVSVNIDDELRSVFGKVVEELKQSGARVRWVKPQSFHLTLKFLGNVNMEEVPEISKAVEQCVEDIEPFSIVFEGLGGLPRDNHPRVIYVAVSEGAEQLKHIAARLEEEMARFGVQREERQFKPHLTLGRLKSFSGANRLIEMIHERATEPFGAFEVSEVCLMMSRLKQDGAEYTVLHRAKL